MRKLTHEVCLIGCGPVGLTLANCLARSPYISSIALVDRKLPVILKQPYKMPNQRVYSINGPSLQIFNSLQVDKRIRQYGVMNEIEVISKESQSFVHWSQNRAIIAQNDQIVSALMSNLKQNPSLDSKIEFIQGNIKNYQVLGDSCDIELSTGQKLSTQLLIGSDGNKSKVKELSRIPTYGWNYRQKAIACTLKISEELKGHNTSGYQIYYEGNVFAFLPLWDNYISIVWSLGLPDFEHFMGQTDAQFVDSINTLIENSNYTLKNQKSYKIIPKIQSIQNKRLSFPLSSLQAGNYTAQRIALVGDAAHSIHPMAGLGVNSGIIDSVLLANNIISSKRTGNDIGQAMSLSSFESKSKSFNYANSITMETIKKTFQITNPVFNYARKIGMGLFEESSFIKGQMKSAVQNNPLISIKPFEWERT